MPVVGRLVVKILPVCLLLSVLTSVTVFAQTDAVSRRLVGPEEEGRPVANLSSEMLEIDHRTLSGTSSGIFSGIHAGPTHPEHRHSLSAPDDHSPRGALWRSAVLPGWGQIYNDQYVKLPFVYGALGGLVVAILRLDDDYDLYNRAFQFKAYQELVDAGQLEENPRASFRPSYDRIADDVGPVSSRPLEIRRNNLRRGRDLSAIGLGLVYGLAMLDAYVSAHLLDFDVGESLGVDVTPGTDGFRISARVTLSRPGD